jgi:hypothetical protein
MERHESYAPGADVAYLELVLAGLGRRARVEEVNCENLFDQIVSTTSKETVLTQNPKILQQFRLVPIENIPPMPLPSPFQPIFGVSRYFDIEIVGGGVARVRLLGGPKQSHKHRDQGSLTILKDYLKIDWVSRGRALTCAIKSGGVDGRFVARVDGSVVKERN